MATTYAEVRDLTEQCQSQTALFNTITSLHECANVSLCRTDKQKYVRTQCVSVWEGCRTDKEMYIKQQCTVVDYKTDIQKYLRPQCASICSNRPDKQK